jgi:signal transduction histidine kinase
VALIHIVQSLSIPRKLAACFALLILVMAVTSVGVYVRLAEIESADRRTEQSYELLKAVSEVLQSLVDQETGVRGYIISGETAFLGSYHSGRQDYPQLLGRAIAQTMDRPDQQQRLHQIDKAAEEWHHEFAEPQIVLAARASTRLEAMINSARGHGKRRLDFIRAQVAEIEQAEHTLLHQHRMAKDTAYRKVRLMLISSGGLSLLVALLSGWMLSRNIAQPITVMADRMRRLAEGEVETPIPASERKDEIGVMVRALRAFQLALRERTVLLATEREHVSQLKQAQKELVETQKLAALGRLVAGVAHELNTPIGSSLTVATALSEKYRRFNDEVERGQLRRSSLTTFLEEVRRAAQLLNISLEQAASQVSSFKQVAVDQAGAQRRRFDLAQVTGQLLATLRPLFKKTTHSVVMDIPEGVEVDGYPGPYGQVISNLVTNALAHGLEGRDTGHVTVRLAHRNSRTVTVEVSDDGRGMAAEVVSRAFEPFFTTKRGQGGSGLGLNIVHNLVTGVLGGRIDIRSTPGQGSTFSLEFPTVTPVQGVAA